MHIDIQNIYCIWCTLYNMLLLHTGPGMGAQVVDELMSLQNSCQACYSGAAGADPAWLRLLQAIL